MSGSLEDLMSSFRAVGDNLRAMGRRTQAFLSSNVQAVRFKIETAFMEALWSILGLSRYLIPLLKFIGMLWLIFLSAIVMYYWIYQHFVPKLLLQEPVHFNFDHENPPAQLNLLMPNDHSGEILSLSHYGKSLPRKFLRPGSIYDFSLTFSVAKSERNQDIGKFMSYMSVVDKLDQVVARSGRPVIVPYHSRLSLLADRVVRLPYTLLGLPETEILEIQMLRHYKEPYSEAEATKSVEITLSRPDVDIMDCHLTIYPELSLFTYALLHFPYVSFSVGVLFCFWGLFITVMFYLGMLFLVRFISNVVEEEGDSEDADHVPPEHAFGQNTRRPRADDRPRPGGGWMSDVMYDPLSSTDNSAAIEKQGESIQKAIEDSLSSAITSIQHMPDSQMTIPSSGSPTSEQWGVRVSGESDDIVSLNSDANGDDADGPTSDQDTRDITISHEYNATGGGDRDEEEEPSLTSVSGIRKRRVQVDNAAGVPPSR